MSVTKCRYFNRGYCANRDNCTYVHNVEECQDECFDKTCQLRHKIECRDGLECHFLKNGTCQFKHLNGPEKIIKTKKKNKMKNYKNKF